MKLHYTNMCYQAYVIVVMYRIVVVVIIRIGRTDLIVSDCTLINHIIVTGTIDCSKVTALLQAMQLDQILVHLQPTLKRLYA